MIEKKEAQKQFSRFSSMRGFADLSRESTEDYIFAFQVAKENKTAVACADSFLDTATSDTRIPSAAEIRKWIYERIEADKPPREERLNQGPHCATCQGFGIKESTHAGDLASVASYCECEAGRRRSHWSKDNASPERVNAARGKLRALKVPVEKQKGLVRAAHLASDYFGDF